MKPQLSFKNIGLIGRQGSSKVTETLKRLMPFLDKKGFQPILEERTAELLLEHSYQEADINMLAEICDLVIVVGGDGSLLGAARAMAKTGVPVVGVNRGRLGFLTDISPDEIEEKIGQVLAGKYTLEERFLLEARFIFFDTTSGEPVMVIAHLNPIIALD